MKGETTDRRCDTRVWSGACDAEERYLCPECGLIHELDHEVHHEVFPHVEGDYTKMH